MANLIDLIEEDAEAGEQTDVESLYEAIGRVHESLMAGTDPNRCLASAAINACLEFDSSLLLVNSVLVNSVIHDAALSTPDPDAESAVQADLLRCVFGNPFRPVRFAPAWRTEAAVGIAAKLYDSREFGNLPVLADALQDAGCENPDVLAHCRGPGPHVRGCWVVDAVLGKE